MDEDTAKLVGDLATRIGIIMEDTGLIALGVHRTSGEARRAALSELDVAAAQIMHLTRAAIALDAKTLRS